MLHTYDQKKKPAELNERTFDVTFKPVSFQTVHKYPAVYCSNLIHIFDVTAGDSVQEFFIAISTGGEKISCCFHRITTLL